MSETGVANQFSAVMSDDDSENDESAPPTPVAQDAAANQAAVSQETEKPSGDSAKGTPTVPNSGLPQRVRMQDQLRVLNHDGLWHPSGDAPG